MRAAILAVEITGKQIFLLFQTGARAFFSRCRFFVLPPKDGRFENRLDGVLDDDRRLPVLAIHTVREPTDQNRLLGQARDSKLIEQRPLMCFDAVSNRPASNIGDAFAAVQPAENFADYSGLFGNNDIAVVFVDAVAVRNGAGNVLCFQRGLFLTFANFAGEVTGIVFCHTLKHRLHHDRLRRVVEGFEYGDDAQTVLFQLVAINSRRITVTGESVELMNDNALAAAPGRLGNHFLEFFAVVSRSGFRLIYVKFSDGMPFTGCPLFDGADLRLDRVTVALVFGRIPAIGKQVHYSSSPTGLEKSS